MARRRAATAAWTGPRLVASNPVPPKSDDPHVCGLCSRGHGEPGTRCERHGAYIERMPTDEERTDADREREANRDPRVALTKIMAMLDIEEDDIEYAGADPVARVRSLVELRRGVVEALDYPDDLTDEETVASVKLVVKERGAAFSAIDEHIGIEPSDADDATKIVRQFANESSPRTEFEELLRLVGMTDDEYALTSANWPIMSASDFLLTRVRAILPELLGQPVTVTPPPRRGRKRS